MRTATNNNTPFTFFRWGILALGLLLLPHTTLATSEGSGGSGARAVVRSTIDAVLAVLKNPALSTAQKQQEIERVVTEHFDFRTLSKLVLARNWRKLSPAQQKEFVHEFKRNMALTYGKNVESYNDEKVHITADREEARGDWTVRSKVIRPGAEDILVDYRLRQKNGIWRMIDVTVEGVSLVANWRSQFQDILSKQGPQKLLAILHEKNEKGEATETKK